MNSNSSSNNNNNTNINNNNYQSNDSTSPNLSNITAGINKNNNNNNNINNNNNKNHINDNNNNNHLLRPLGENSEFKILEDPSNVNALFQLFQETIKYYHCSLNSSSNNIDSINSNNSNNSNNNNNNNNNNNSNNSNNCSGSNINNEQMIFFSLIGSQSFNLNIETSDQDYFGVYKTNIDEILSFKSYYYNRIPKITFLNLNNSNNYNNINNNNNNINNNNNSSTKNNKEKDNIVNPLESIIHLKPDIAIHELRYYFKLLLLGNPKNIEPLFINKYCISSDEWLEISKIRKEFINLTSLDHFYSTVKVLYFAIKNIIDELNSSDNISSNSSDRSKQKQQQQSTKTLNDRKSIFKKSYHIIRLLYEMNDILNGNDLTIWLANDSKERNLLYKIRAGEEFNEQSCFEMVDTRYRQFEKEYAQLKQTIENGTNTKFIKEPTYGLEYLNKLLVKYRRRDIDLCKPLEQFNFNNVNNSYTTINSSDNINNSNDSYSIAIKIMKQNGISGTLIYFGPSGSHLHGLENQDQEISDWIGIYAAPTDDIVSLFPPPLKHDCSGYILNSDEYIALNSTPAPNRVNQQFKKDSFSKGITLYELKYALQLMVNGSYRLLECIFASSGSILSNHPLKSKFYISDAWNELVNDTSCSRSIYGNSSISKYSNSNLLQQMWGLSKSCNSNCSKFKKLKNQLEVNENQQLVDTSYSRNLFFSFYLLVECQRILDQEIPLIYIQRDSNNYQQLMKLKNNQVTINEIESLLEFNNQQLDQIKIKLDKLKISQRADIIELQTINSFNSFYNKVRKSL